MTHKTEKASVATAGFSKEVVKSTHANDSFNNSYSLAALQVARLRRRFRLSEHLALAVAQLAYSGRA